MHLFEIISNCDSSFCLLTQLGVFDVCRNQGSIQSDGMCVLLTWLVSFSMLMSLIGLPNSATSLWTRHWSRFDYRLSSCFVLRMLSMLLLITVLCSHSIRVLFALLIIILSVCIWFVRLASCISEGALWTNELWEQDLLADGELRDQETTEETIGLRLVFFPVFVLFRGTECSLRNFLVLGNDFECVVLLVYCCVNTGGMTTSCTDLARFGHLWLNQGNWSVRFNAGSLSVVIVVVCCSDHDCCCIQNRAGKTVFTKDFYNKAMSRPQYPFGPARQYG